MELAPPPKGSRRTASRLPCTISHRGEASAEYVPEGGLRSFRGRKLERGDFVVPDSHEMYAGESVGGTTDWKLKYRLEKHGFFYQHDNIPNDDSPFPNALRWLDMASALQKPVDSAHLAAKEKQLKEEANEEKAEERSTTEVNSTS